MASGYWNRILRVDLTAGTSHNELVEDTIWKQCVGGAGYGAMVLLNEVAADTDPLGPDNRLVFALGPYQAGNAPGNAKWTVCAKSPLTNTYGDSAAGANWGIALKKAGYDALIVQGAAAQPVYLRIDDGQVEILDAGTLWGRDAFETADLLAYNNGGKSFAVVCIGPAGERMVRMACVVADKHSFAGRCGLGAVMGSKRLKAITVRGTKTVPVNDPDTLRELVRKTTLSISRVARSNGLREHGTPNLCVTAESVGDMPIKYWNGDTWPEGAAKLGAPNYTEVLKAKPLPCLHCPVGCHRSIRTTDWKGNTIEGPGPEYETLGMLGSNLLIDDPVVVAAANDLCNRMGIDTISVGSCIGLALECHERGLLQTVPDDLTLAWGNSETVLELIRQISLKEGFGALFADGSVAAARRIHPQAMELVAHVKGLDLPAHDPRACWSLGINYATSTRGACHMRGVVEDVEMGGFFVPELGIVPDWSELFKSEHKTELTVKLQDYCAWLNSLVVCAFMVDGGDLSMTDLTAMFNAITGWNWTLDDVARAGARITTLQRLVNVRDGHGRSTDTIPPKIRIPARTGFRAGKTPAPLEPYLDEYYAMRKWDQDGRPTTESLRAVGLVGVNSFIE